MNGEQLFRTLLRTWGRTSLRRTPLRRLNSGGRAASRLQRSGFSA